MKKTIDKFNIAADYANTLENSFIVQSNAIDKIISDKYFNGNTNETFLDNFKTIWNEIINYKQTIIYGSVQSGKTKYVVKLAFQALKSTKYNIVFYLSGITNSLHEQNLQDFIYFQNQLGNSTSILNEPKDCCIIESNTIVLLKKNDSTLNLLKKKKNCPKCSAKNLKSLILDDECDFASPTNKSKQTTINSKLNNFIKDEVNKPVYVGISATPFINISKYQKFKPTSVVILKNNSKYQGLEFYAKEKYYKEISDSHYENIKTIIKDYIKFNSIQTDFSQMLVSTNILNKNNTTIFEYIKSTINRMDAKEFINRTKPIVKLWTGEDKEVKEEVKPFSINIGNVMLGRGIRLKTLSHVLLDSKVEKFNSATYIQKARWFGYDKNVQKIYTNKKLINFYCKDAPKFDAFMRSLFEDDPQVTDFKMDEINNYLKQNPNLKIR